jgi:Leucine-rich repeat (LRR) protein
VDRSSLKFAEKPKIKTFIGAQEYFDFKPSGVAVAAADSDNPNRDVLLQLYNKYKDVSESECDFDAFSEWGNPDIRKWQGIHVDSKGNIESLVLRSYKLSKNFPAIISSEFNSLKYLDLSDNSMAGDISENWASFNSLVYLHLDRNSLTSSSLDEILPKFIDLKYINLSNNQFAGALPPRLGELIYLEEVYLNSNKFNGLLPIDYGNLVNLRVLNLANNQVSGCIPEEYSNLQDLQLFDVSNNNLTTNGIVPSSLAAICKL